MASWPIFGFEFPSMCSRDRAMSFRKSTVSARNQPTTPPTESGVSQTQDTEEPWPPFPQREAAAQERPPCQASFRYSTQPRCPPSSLHRAGWAPAGGHMPSSFSRSCLLLSASLLALSSSCCFCWILRYRALWAEGRKSGTPAPAFSWPGGPPSGKLSGSRGCSGKRGSPGCPGSSS